MEIPRLKYLWSYLYHWSALMPNETAIHHEGQCMTYAGLEKQVNNMTNAFLESGIEKGDRIVTILPSRPEFLITYLAATQLGAIVTPFDVRYKLGDLERFLAKAEPKIIIALATSNENIIWEQLATIAPSTIASACYFIGETGFGIDYRMLIRGNGLLEQAVLQRRKELKEEEGDLIIFTGGTTGQPKGALLSHGNVAAMAFHEEAFLRTELNRAGFRGRISTLAALPPSHVGGCIECIGTALVGAYTLFFLDYWSPTKVLEMTSAHAIPWLGGVPTMYSILLSLPELDQFDLSGVYLALLSGERVTLELLTDLKNRICPNIINGYGSTEAGPELTFTRPEDSPKALAEGYVGLPLPTVQLKIADESGKELPLGTEGEVLVRSAFTIKKYFEMPEEDLRGFTDDGYCKTGDLGFLTPMGGLYLSGRKKHIIRVGGYTVMPTEVEEIALQLPEIALAAALGVPHPIYQEVVWLFVVFHEGKTLSEGRLQEHIAAKLANYKVPKRILVREAIPTTRIGKSDRKALKKELDLIGWEHL